MAELDFSESRATDVDRRFAFVVPLSAGYHRWHDAERFQVDLTARVADDLPVELRPDLRVTAYEIGPAAEWFPTFLVTLADAPPELFDSAADAIDIARTVFDLARGVFRWSSDQRSASEEPQVGGVRAPALSAPVIAGMCAGHYRDSYGDLEDIDLDWHSHSTSYYGTADHPAGIETYTVSIRKKRTTTVYVVEADGTPVSHFKVTGKQTTPLDLPRWEAEEWQGTYPPPVERPKVA